MCWLGSFEVELECIILAFEFCACIKFDMSIRVSGGTRDGYTVFRGVGGMPIDTFTSRVIQSEL